MHSDLVEKVIARRLRALGDESHDAPYEWAEFLRRRDTRAAAAGLIGRNRHAVMGVAAAAAALAVGLAIASLSHHRRWAAVPVRTAAGAPVSAGAEPVATAGRLAQQRTRELEGWLADLPRNPAIVRVGAHAAVISLQDQIAALDDLMSAERVAGAPPARLGGLERRRAQLVSSLAQLQYAEMLASASP